MAFSKIFFSSDGFFRLFLFRSEFFGDVDSMHKLVLFRRMKFSGRFRHSFIPFRADFGFHFFYELHFFSFEVEISQKWHFSLADPKFAPNRVKECLNRPENPINGKRTNFCFEITPQKKSERKKIIEKIHPKNIYF